ncbi:MAG: hypothetical protein KGD67_12575, partial [Candidatus Lokiarchaeota archaeon]|nr:hypothetical protein [Candidatus Lokiarchaeota archaeon]
LILIILSPLYLPILNEIISIITLSYIYLKVKTILKSTQKKDNEELTYSLKTHLSGIKNFEA